MPGMEEDDEEELCELEDDCASADGETAASPVANTDALKSAAESENERNDMNLTLPEV